MTRASPKSRDAETLSDKIHNDPRWPPFLHKIGKAPEQLAKIEFKVPLPAMSRRISTDYAVLGRNSTARSALASAETENSISGSRSACASHRSSFSITIC